MVLVDERSDVLQDLQMPLAHLRIAPAQVGRLVLALQRRTNNVAEYCGLIIGLEVALWTWCMVPVLLECCLSNSGVHCGNSCKLWHWDCAGSSAAGHQAPEHSRRQQTGCQAGGARLCLLHTMAPVQHTATMS